MFSLEFFSWQCPVQGTALFEERGMDVVVLKDAWGFSGCPWDVAEL